MAFKTFQGIDVEVTSDGLFWVRWEASDFDIGDVRVDTLKAAEAEIRKGIKAARSASGRRTFRLPLVGRWSSYREPDRVDHVIATGIRANDSALILEGMAARKSSGYGALRVDHPLEEAIGRLAKVVRDLDDNVLDLDVGYGRIDLSDINERIAEVEARYNDKVAKLDRLGGLLARAFEDSVAMVDDAEAAERVLACIIDAIEKALAKEEETNNGETG